VGGIDVRLAADHSANSSRIARRVGLVATLVLQCRNDVIAPAEVGEYVRDHLPNATYELLDATGQDDIAAVGLRPTR